MRFVTIMRTVLLLCIAGVLVSTGMILYDSVHLARTPYYPNSNMKVIANDTVAFQDIWQFIYTSTDIPSESEYRKVQMVFHYSEGASNCLLLLEIPFKIENLTSPDGSIIEGSERYNSTSDYSSFTMTLAGTYTEILFQWRTLRRVSYDEFRYLIPCSPRFGNCTVEKYIIEVYSIPETFIDLSKTFPLPQEIIARENKYLDYTWTFFPSNSNTRFTDDIPTLQVAFASPRKSSEVEYAILESGIFIGLGTGFLARGLTEGIMACLKDEARTHAEVRENNNRLNP